MCQILALGLGLRQPPRNAGAVSCHKLGPKASLWGLAAEEGVLLVRIRHGGCCAHRHRGLGPEDRRRVGARCMQRSRRGKRAALVAHYDLSRVGPDSEEGDLGTRGDLQCEGVPQAGVVSVPLRRAEGANKDGGGLVGFSSALSMAEMRIVRHHLLQGGAARTHCWHRRKATLRQQVQQVVRAMRKLQDRARNPVQPLLDLEQSHNRALPTAAKHCCRGLLLPAAFASRSLQIDLPPYYRN